MPAGVTLLEMATDLRAVLGYSLSIQHGVDQQPALYRALRRTQVELWQMHDWPEFYQEVDKPLAAGTQTINIGPNIDFNHLNVLYWRAEGTRQRKELKYGIWAADRSRSDFQEFGDTGTPEKYAFWAATSGAPTDTVEIWPVPAMNVTITIGGRIALLALTAETDVCTLDSELIIAHAALPIMLRNKDPTSQSQQTKAQQLFNKLRARQGANKRDPFLIRSRI